MADGFLEKSFENLRDRKKTITKANNKSLSALLKKNRSYRGYDQRYRVTRESLEQIVSVNELLPSAKNQQALRFYLVSDAKDAAVVLSNIKLGGMLPELHLPFKGAEPMAFIVMCTTVAESKMLHIDAGISAQSMLLKAVELGYNGIIIGAFNAKNIKQAFDLNYDPILILAIGKGSEHIQLVETDEDAERAYYREEGVHYVPKIRWKELIINK